MIRDYQQALFIVVLTVTVIEDTGENQGVNALDECNLLFESRHDVYINLLPK